MRVVTDDNFIQRNRQIAQYSFFFSIAVLIGALFFGGNIATGSPDAAFFMNCVVPVFMMALILFSVRMSNRWIREPLPWTALPESLRGYSSGATLYNYIFPARHVLVSPAGVFVLVPYFHDRPIKVKDDNWRILGGPMAALMTFARQERIGNPTVEASFEAESLQRYLNKHIEGNTVEVQPVIVFTHPRARLFISGDQAVPITFAHKVMTRAAKNKDEEEALDDELQEIENGDKYMTLREFLHQQKKADLTTLTDEQVEALEEKLIYEYV